MFEILAHWFVVNTTYPERMNFRANSLNAFFSGTYFPISFRLNRSFWCMIFCLLNPSKKVKIYGYIRTVNKTKCEGKRSLTFCLGSKLIIILWQMSIINSQDICKSRSHFKYIVNTNSYKLLLKKAIKSWKYISTLAKSAATHYLLFR